MLANNKHTHTQCWSGSAGQAASLENMDSGGDVLAYGVGGENRGPSGVLVSSVNDEANDRRANCV